MNNLDKLHIITINCKSLDVRFNEIKLLVEENNPDIICVTETWLSNEKVAKYKYNINGYVNIFQNRQHGNGGGLAMFIKDSIIYNKLNIETFDGGHLETQTIEIILKNNRYLHILNYYNPCKNIDINELEHYINHLQHPFLAVGDLNCHTPLLKEGDANNITGKNLEILLVRNDVCLINPLNFYTYLDPRTGNTSCLDVCLCSPSLLESTNITRLEDIGSDHYPLLLKIEKPPIRNIIMNAPKWNLKGVNWNQWAKDIPSITINRNTTNVEALHNDIEERINHSNKINIKKSKTKETSYMEKYSMV